MKLTDYTDYTLRVLMYCAGNTDRLVTIQEISDAYEINKNNLRKIVHALALDGVIDTTRGRGGGFRLARPADQIMIGPIVRRAETDFTLVECFDPEKNECCLTPRCTLKGVLKRALDAYFAELDSVALSDVVRSKKPAVATVKVIRRDTGRKAAPRGKA